MPLSTTSWERDAIRPEAVGAALVALAAFGAVLALWLSGGGSMSVPWAPTLGLSLTFTLDGIGALYALLATGVGAAVFAYSIAYMPRYLEHVGRPLRDGRSFYAWLLLFMVAMVGLATAEDLVLLFLFFDLTAVCSYFLIGYERGEQEARWAALMALVVTGATAVLMLLGVALVLAEYGTASIPELARRADAGPVLAVACALIVVAALAKSAQLPFQFWLRRAMIASTPVSAYLHSAAMVAAGVLVIGRVYPLLEPFPALRTALVVVGFSSALVAGVLALAEERLKPVLAYSTAAQYGYVVALYGLGGKEGATAAGLYVLMHGIAKAALFLTAGGVTEATGQSELGRLGGLWRELRALAVASFVAVAAIAALPLTLGFFADELFFKAVLAAGPVPTALSLAVAVLTFVYMLRFWVRIFLGPRRAKGERLPLAMVVPPAALGLLLLVGGVYVAPFESLAEAAGAASLGAPAPAAAAYHLDLRATNVLALASFALGGAGLAAHERCAALARRVAALGARVGPDRAYRAGLRALHAGSDRAHTIEVRDLRTRVAAVLVPGAALVLLGELTTASSRSFRAGAIGADDLAVVLTLAAGAAAALATTRPRHHLRLALTLSATGFSLAAVFALLGAPDVALVAVLVEIALTLFIVTTLGRLPERILQRERRVRSGRGRGVRDVVIAVAAGASACVVVWSVLSQPLPHRPIAPGVVARADEAHAKDVVTAILADFRALDTLGEVSVLLVALIGLVGLLGRRRPA